MFIQCAPCGQKFYTFSALYDHRKKNHEDQSPFMCEVCEMAFDQLAALSKHKSANASRTGHSAKPFSCCENSFKAFTLLVAHQDQPGCAQRTAEVLASIRANSGSSDALNSKFST